jgi:O-antigen/teichoic acid export membrane protein
VNDLAAADRTTPYGRLVGMSAAFATSNLARTAIAFATSLVVARPLGIDDFGRWTLCTAWAAALTTVVDFGFGVLLTRDAARDDPAIGREVAVAFIARLAALLPIALLFLLAPSTLSSDSATAAGLRVVPLIAVAGAAYGCLAPVFRASPRALVVALGIETTGALVQWAGAWWLVETGGRLVELLMLAALVQTVQFIAAVALWWRIRIGRPAIEWPSPSVIARTLRDAWPFAAAGLLANAQLRLAPLLLGFLASPATVAAFGVASRLGGVVRMVPQAAFAGALPVLSHEARYGASEVVRVRFERTLLAFVIAAAGVVVLFAAPIVSLTYGDAFAAAVVPLVWTGIGLVPALVNSGRKVYLYATGHEGVAVRWSAVTLALQASSCVALIPAFGAAGAAAGLALGETLVWAPLRKAGIQPGELSGAPVRVVGDSPLVS